MKPILLLDIDGVINPEIARNKSFSNNKHNNHWENSWKEITFLRPSDNKPIKFIYSIKMIEKIKSLEEIFTIVWHTTWQEHTQKLLLQIMKENALYYPYIKRVDGLDSPILHLGKKWWKINSLENFIQSNPRNFYFFDDLITSPVRKDIQQIAAKYGVIGDSRKTNSHLGLTENDFEQLNKFYKSLK